MLSLTRSPVVLGCFWLLFALTNTFTQQSLAQKGIFPAEGATFQSLQRPEQGFVDDAFHFDHAGSRFLYVVSHHNRSHLIVFDVVQQVELHDVKLPNVASHPTRVEFRGDGKSFLVWYKNKSNKDVVLRLSLHGKVRKRFGPTTHIARTHLQGEDVLVLHNVTPQKTKKVHTVTVYSTNGKRLVKPHTLVLDAKNYSAKLDFRVHHWSNHFLTALGIKGGDYDSQADQRSPNVEAWYQMLGDAFSKRSPILNVIKQRENMMLLESHKDYDMAIHNQQLSFVHKGEMHAVKLAEPLSHYKKESLVTQRMEAGVMFFTLTIDPVHPDAAAKRRAVKSWTDLYEYNLKTKKATRRARIQFPKARRVRWQAKHDNWVLVPRHIGYERGGPDLLFYKLN